LGQFDNPANVKIHYETTAQEILRDTDGDVDFVVSAAGTGGTATGIAKGLKEELPDVKVVVVEPEESQTLGKGEKGPHKIQGIGAGFVPSIYDAEVIDEIFPVANDDAGKTLVNLAKNEGIFANGLGIRVVLQGFMFGALSLIAFKVGETVTGLLEGGQTMAFIVLALTQVVQSFNMRSEHSLFKIGAFTNKTLNKAALTSLLMVILVVFTPIRGAFGLIALPYYLHLIAVALIITPFVVMEISKAIGLIKHHD
jgi:hypothetical protein